MLCLQKQPAGALQSFRGNEVTRSLTWMGLCSWISLLRPSTRRMAPVCPPITSMVPPNFLWRGGSFSVLAFSGSESLGPPQPSTAYERGAVCP